MVDSSSSSSSSLWDTGKLFVGGISWETSEAALREYFAKYGEVVEAVSVKDRGTGNPRGFAFVLFSHPDAVERALNDNDHRILGRAVDVKRARPRNDQHQNQNQHENRGPNRSGGNTHGGSNRNHASTKKIFVGGLSAEVTEEVFKSYFEEFGRVTDVVVIYDNMTHRSRGFGFIEFETEEAVDKVIQKGAHELSNKRVEVKIAMPRDGCNHRNTGSANQNNYNPRIGGGVGYGYGYYQGGLYPAPGPRYGMYPVYAPAPISGYAYGASGYGRGYAAGAYGQVGYGPPFISPRSIRNEQGVGATRQNPVAYGRAAIYPGYFNGAYGGYFSMPAGGYYGVVSGNDKLNQTSSDVQPTSTVEILTSQAESLKLDTRCHSDC